MDPVVLDNALPDDLRAALLNDVQTIVRNRDYSSDTGFGRIISNSSRLDMYSRYFLPIVRRLYDCDDLMPSYNVWAQYSGVKANLKRHKDKNACTYTVDYCLSQHEPWGLFVEGREYVLEENQALVFMGEEQEHWRPAFPLGNRVEMVFFHYVRPDHWFFNGGPPSDNGMM